MPIMWLVLDPGDIMVDGTDPQKTLPPRNLYSRGGDRQTRRKQRNVSLGRVL